MKKYILRVGAGALLSLLTGLCGCGLIGAALPYAGVKMYFACIPEWTFVDTPTGARPIQTVEPGDSVIGFSGRPVRVLEKQAYLESPETIFLRVTFSGGAAVDLCQMHRLAGIRARDLRVGQMIDGREVTNLEARRDVVRSYDLRTDDRGYRIQGVRVNSMIEEMRAAAFSGISSEKAGHIQ